MPAKTRMTPLVVILLAACLLGAAFLTAPAAPVTAATSCVPNGSVTISSIVPSTINNSAPTTVTILGSNFQSGASVVLEGYGAVATTFDSASQLTVTIPAGVPGKPAGIVYNVDVFNPTATPDQDCAILTSGITVIGTAPTKAPTTPEPTSFQRPQLIVATYSASVTHVYPSQNFDFSLTLQGVGQTTAHNVTATFVTGDLIPRDNGGVHYVGDLAPGQTVDFTQPMRVSGEINSYEAVIKLQVAYNDDYGKVYTDNFDVAAFPVYYAASTPTPTPTLAYRSQLVLTSYQTVPAKLTPGEPFTVDMDITNVSSILARQIVLSLNVDPASQALVAPLNTSNTRFVEELTPGQTQHLQFSMVISGAASGQLIPLTIDMVYLDEGNTSLTQTENLSLRIETEPFLLVHFLTVPPSPIKVGDTIDIPVEVVNIGTNSLNVSTIEVTSETMEVTDGSLYVGPLDAGTSGVVSAKAVPNSPGTATLTVSIHYLDDYQQQQTVTRELIVEVQDEPTPTPSAGDGNPSVGPGGFGGSGAEQNLTIFDRLLRALLGFFGLATRSPSFNGGNLERNGGNFQVTPGSSQNNNDGNQDFEIPAP